MMILVYTSVLKDCFTMIVKHVIRLIQLILIGVDIHTRVVFVLEEIRGSRGNTHV